MWNSLLIGARLLQFAGAVVLLGSALFYLYGLPVAAPLPSPDRRPWTRLLVLAALAGIVGTVLWVMAETVLFSGEPADGVDPAAVWVVFSETRFGRICLWRIGLLLVSLVFSLTVTRERVLWALQVVLGCVIAATFAWTGHGATTAGWPGFVHLVSDVLHLWLAAVWFGALLPLGMLVSRARQSQLLQDARAASFGLERFSGFGAAVVAALILTGLVNSWFMFGESTWRDAFESSYGMTLLIKIALFGLMLTLAAANRFWLAPRLGRHLREQGAMAPATLGAVKVSVLVESGIAVAVLVAVAVLGTLEPPSAQ